MVNLRWIWLLLLVALLVGCPAGEGQPDGEDASSSAQRSGEGTEANAPGSDALAPPASGAPLRTLVLVIDGLIPESVTPVQTPQLCRIAQCPGAPRTQGGSRATVYAQARDAMLSQTNANHVAMMTGAYGDVSGAVGNAFYDRRGQVKKSLVEPAMILVPTVFDVLGDPGGKTEGGSAGASPSQDSGFGEASVAAENGGSAGASPSRNSRALPNSQALSRKTAVIAGKEKLRRLFDCTKDNGKCAASNDNPEGVSVSHVRPSFIKGSAVRPALGSGDCPAEPALSFGVAKDACIMDLAIKLIVDEDPAFMLINLGKVDQAQHFFGPGSADASRFIMKADREVGRLVQHLQNNGKWESTVLFVLSDHSFSNQGKAPDHRIDLDAVLQADRKNHSEAWGANGGLEEAFAVVNAGGATMVTLKSISGEAQTLNTAQADALKRMREVALFEKPGVRRAGVSEALYRLPHPGDPGHTVAEVHPDWHLDTARAGDLIVTAMASGAGGGAVEGGAADGSAGASPSQKSKPSPQGARFAGANPFKTKAGYGYAFARKGSFGGRAIGNHGHPGARHIPFIIASGGDFVVDQVIEASDPAAVNEGDDTAALPEQAEVVDVAPTILWLQGLLAPDAKDAKALLPQSEGRVLREAFREGWAP